MPIGGVYDSDDNPLVKSLRKENEELRECINDLIKHFCYSRQIVTAMRIHRSIFKSSLREAKNYCENIRDNGNNFTR